MDTGTINKRPSVQIDEHGPLHRGETVTFTATITDANDKIDALTVEWRVGDTYEAALDQPRLSCEGKDRCSYTLPAQTKDELWVVVKVNDNHSASASASRRLSIENRAPVAQIERTEPSTISESYPLLTSFAFSAKADDADPGDKDHLAFTWTVTLNTEDHGGQTIGCSENSDTKPTCSFIAKSSGKYRVTLTVEDPSHAVTAADPIEFKVAEDGPPCIDRYAPDSLQPVAFAAENNTFTVYHVADDVDPYPYVSAKNGTFRWSYRRGTSGEFSRYSTSSNQLIFAENSFRIGDQVQLRVEYQDSQGSLASCNPDSTCCSLNRDDCRCPQWITWTVTFQ